MGRTKKTETDPDLQPKPKQRKVSSGPLRDKSRTMARMVAAVGKVIQKKGYPGLTAPNIALAAGVDKKLVWTYFKGVDNLVEEYLLQRDFWKTGGKSIIDQILIDSEKAGAEEANNLLQSQFDILMKDKALQKIIHWELGENKKVLRTLADKREIIGEQLLELVDPYFKNTDINFRATIALLLGGVYYLSLHAKTNGSTVCGIDVNEEEGKSEIEKTIRSIVFNSFKMAEVKKNN